MRVAVLPSTSRHAFSAVFLIAICSSLYFNASHLKNSDVELDSADSQDAGSASSHCPSSRQSQADTVSLLQGGRIRVERLSEDELQGEQYTERVPEKAALSKDVAIHRGVSQTATHPSGLFLLSRVRRLRSAVWRELASLHKTAIVGIQQTEDSAGIGIVLLGIVFAGLGVPIFCCTLFHAAARLGSHSDARKREVPQYARGAPGHFASSTAALSWRQVPTRWTQASVTATPTVESVPRRSTTVYVPGPSARHVPSSAALPRAQPQYPGSSVPPLLSVEKLPTFDRLPRLNIAAPELLPPPIRPEMVLKVEGRFGVPLDLLHQRTNLSPEGGLPIVGYSGDALLQARVQWTAASKRSLTITHPRTGGLPYATVEPRFGTEEASHVLAIRGSQGALYGTLEQYGSRAFCLSEDGHAILSIDGDTTDMQFAVLDNAGSQIAAGMFSPERFGKPHLEVRLSPGTDTVLVLACILAYIIFWS